MERSKTLTVYPHPVSPSTLYSTQPFVGRGGGYKRVSATMTKASKDMQPVANNHGPSRLLFEAKGGKIQQIPSPQARDTDFVLGDHTFYPVPRGR